MIKKKKKKKATSVLLDEKNKSIAWEYIHLV